jgi:hypothetical protein
MKKFIIPLILVLFLLIIIPATVSAAEWELGLGYTPLSNEDLADDASFQESGLTSFHAGYSFWWLFYASWDSFIMPPYLVESMTGSLENDVYKEGYYRPGFLNMYDVGIRIHLGPVMGFATVGVNTLYVYRQDEDMLDVGENIGANLRLGLGARFDWWGITASISSIQPSIDQAVMIIENMSSGDDYLKTQAEEMFLANLVPSIMLVMYF